MSNQQPLWRTLYFQPLYRRLAKVVGYTGFPSRELYDRLHSIADECGAKPLAQALADLVTLDGHCISLTPEARRLCWQLLGPPPEAWASFYRDADGSSCLLYAQHQAPQEPLRSFLCQGIRDLRWKALRTSAIGRRQDLI